MSGDYRNPTPGEYPDVTSTTSGGTATPGSPVPSGQNSPIRPSSPVNITLHLSDDEADIPDDDPIIQGMYLFTDTINATFQCCMHPISDPNDPPTVGAPPVVRFSNNVGRFW